MAHWLATKPQLMDFRLPSINETFEEFVQKVKQALASLGLWIENGIAWVRELVADKITTKKLCLEENGEEICLTKTQLKELLEKNQTQSFLLKNLLLKNYLLRYNKIDSPQRLTINNQYICLEIPPWYRKRGASEANATRNRKCLGRGSGEFLKVENIYN